MNTDTSDDSTRPSRWRRMLSSWWIPILLLAVAALLVARIWMGDADERAMTQQKNLQTLQYAGVATIISFAWFVLLAPVRSRIRFGSLALVAVMGIAFACIFVIEGVDGDLRPIWRYRWSATPEEMVRDFKQDSTTAPSPATAAPAAAGFTQFFGSQRDGTVAGLKLETDWIAHPPRELWRRPVGPAWSGFAISGHRAITQEQRDERELIVCYDLTTGSPLWEHATETRYATTIAGIGPRATPTIHGDVVIACGATGRLTCCDLETGRERWSIDTLADTGAELQDWGMAGSPLVEEDMVIINTGGSQATVAAYDLNTGKRRWASGSEATSYASPAILVIHGQRQLVMQNQYTITGHDPKTGLVQWSHPTPGGHPKVAQPVLVGDNRLVVSSGYGTGSNGFELVKDDQGRITAKSLWRNVYLKAKFANFIEHGGHLYGLNDGTLTCLSADTGQRLWRGGRLGHGQLLRVDDVLLITAESGEVVLVEATPAEYRELARFKALKDKTWNSPALAGRLLVVRNDREAACFELAESE